MKHSCFFVIMVGLFLIGCNSSKKETITDIITTQAQTLMCTSTLGFDIPHNCESITIEKPFKGLKNFRKLTPPLNPNIILRDGMVYRSDAFGQLTANDKEKLAKLGVKTMIDLRSKEEIQNDPNESISSVKNIYNFPIGTDPAKLEKLDLDENIVVKIRELYLSGEFDEVEKLFIDNNIDIEKHREIRYAEFVTNFTEQISKTLKQFSYADAYPIFKRGHVF